MQILDAQTANTDGSQTEIVWHGGTGNVVAEGVFDTCTITVECQWNGGAWHVYDATTTFTAGGIAAITLPAGFKIRGSVTSIDTSTSVDLHIIYPDA